MDGVEVAAAGRVLLRVQQLRINAGEHVAIIGPNGAGKSTLLKLMGALVKAQQGQVQVLGRSIGPPNVAAPSPLDGQARRALRRETGLLMQGLHLVPRLTARENVLIGALARLQGVEVWRSLLRWYPQALVDEAHAALAALGLGALANTRADRLSGGERQKVALARLQLQRPRLVLADEPTSALDPAATQQVCQTLRALACEPGHTVITVVHDLDLLPLLAARIIGMAAGRVQWDQPIGRVTESMLNELFAQRADDSPTEEAPLQDQVARTAQVARA